MSEPSKIIAIHQPNFIPWLGYFHKIAQSDVFILLDDVEYSKNSFINRNRIKTPQRSQWLTLPVRYSGRSQQLIMDCEINLPNRSFTKLIKTLETNYRKAPFFHEYFPSLKKKLDPSTNQLAFINENLIRWAMIQLDITTPIIKSSTLSITATNPTERLVEICKTVKGKKYLAGFGGKKYQEEQKFMESKIQLVHSNFNHPTYEQLWGEFIPNLSIIDLIFNCGPNAKQYFNG